MWESLKPEAGFRVITLWPDSVSSVQNCILALNTMDRYRGNNAERSAENLESSASYQARLEKLLEIRIPLSQIDEIKAARAVPRRTKIFAPIDGFVLARTISA